MNKSIIILKNLTKFDYLNKNIILENISLNIRENECFTFTGIVNSGKSLLIKILGLIIKNFSAENFSILNYDINKINTKDLFILKKNIGFAFQNYTLFDSLSVEENVGFFLNNYTKLSKKEIQYKVSSVLEKFDLRFNKTTMINELSGGMKKRISIARSIIYDPKILFLDEPTGGLDPINCNLIVDLIKKIRKYMRITIVSTSTDIHYIRKISNKVCLLHNKNIHEANVEDLIENPSPLFKSFFYGE